MLFSYLNQRLRPHTYFLFFLMLQRRGLTMMIVLSSPHLDRRLPVLLVCRLPHRVNLVTAREERVFDLQIFYIVFLLLVQPILFFSLSYYRLDCLGDDMPHYCTLFYMRFFRVNFIFIHDLTNTLDNIDCISQIDHLPQTHP